MATNKLPLAVCLFSEMSGKKKHNTSYLPLIEQWEAYLAESGNDSLEHFAVWMLQQKRAAAAYTDDMDAYFSENSYAQGDIYHSAKAGYAIGRLFKFVRMYSKHIFSDLGYSSPDEFGLLAAIDAKKTTTKKVVIREQLNELTTGMDMLRRMQKQGWITEQVNPADKREKLITITSAGSRLLGQTYAALVALPDVLADLSPEERVQLVRLLEKLDSFHTRQHAAQG